MNSWSGSSIYNAIESKVIQSEQTSTNQRLFSIYKTFYLLLFTIIYNYYNDYNDLGGGDKALTMTITPWNLIHGQW